MSSDQEKSTTSLGAEQAPNPALPQYPPQPFPGAPYPPPPGAYTWYYPPPADPNGDPSAPPPAPYVMFPPPGIMYGYPPPPTPAQGKSHLFCRVFRVCLISVFYPCVNKYPKVTDHFQLLRLFPLSPVRSANRSRWRYDSSVSPLFRVVLTGTSFVSSARIVLPRVSGATKRVLAKDVKSMVSRTRAWTACVRPEKSESSAVLTNVKVKARPLRQLHTQVSSSGLPKNYAISHISL